MNPLVSILIPAYNAEQWIAETIKSALDQACPKKEIIVVDDGSTDRTVAVARQFDSKSVLVVTQPNAGASAARNKAFSLCQGDYIQWLDADDLLSPDKISSQIEAMENFPDKKTLFSSRWAYFYYRTSRAKFQPSDLWREHRPVEWLICKMTTGQHMQTSTWLVSRELTEAAGLWDTRVSLDDDGEYFCRVVAASESIRFVPAGAVFYRASNPASLSKAGRGDRKLNSLFLSMQLQIQRLLALEKSERTRQACVAYLNTWLPWFDPERQDLVKQCEALAVELGGKLEPRRLPWKYEWIRLGFGRAAANRAESSWNHWKAAWSRSWDKIHE